MKAPHALFLSAVLVAVNWAAAAPEPDQHRIGALLKELRELDLTAEPGSDYVSPEATTLMKALKSELRVLITKTINSPVVSRLGPDGLEAAVTSALQNEGVSVGQGPTSLELGVLEEIHFEQIHETSSLLVARFSLSFPCGSDSSVYLYRRTGNHWELVLVRGLNEIEDLGGILDHPQTHLASVGNEKDPLLIISTIPTQCTSCWSAVQFELLRPGRDADHPQSILRGDATTYRCNEEPYAIAIENSGFTLVTETTDAKELTNHVTHVTRYEMSGDEVRIAAETELFPPGFVDVWSRLPWDEASHQVASSRRAKLREWHRKISHPEAVTFLSPYKLVPPGRAGKIQVGAACMVTGPESAVPLYFTFQLDRDRFVLWDISETTPTGSSQ